MATNTLKPVAVTPLDTGWTIIYTVPASTIFTVAMAHLANVLGQNIVVRVCVVPSGGSPLVENSVLWDFTLGPNEVLRILQGDMWPAGSTLQARLDVDDAANFKLSGIETV